MPLNTRNSNIPENPSLKRKGRPRKAQEPAGEGQTSACSVLDPMIRAALDEEAERIAKHDPGWQPTSENLYAIAQIVLKAQRRKNKAAQKEGIKAARKNGVKLGRPRKPIPANFGKIYNAQVTGEITRSEAAKRLGVSESLYCTWRKIWEKNVKPR